MKDNFNFVTGSNIFMLMQRTVNQTVLFRETDYSAYEDLQTCNISFIHYPHVYVFLLSFTVFLSKIPFLTGKGRFPEKEGLIKAS